MKLYPCFAVATFFLIFSNAAQATTYCAYPPGAYFVEGENKRDWKMTSSKNRIILNPTQNKPTTHCNVNFSNLGGLKSLEIIKKPTLNSATTPNLYTVSYKAEKTGNDTMIVRVIWFDRSGKIINSIVNYNITVVDHDL